MPSVGVGVNVNNFWDHGGDYGYENVYICETGPGQWWRRLTCQRPEYRQATVGCWGPRGLLSQHVGVRVRTGSPRRYARVRSPSPRRLVRVRSPSPPRLRWVQDSDSEDDVPLTRYYDAPRRPHDYRNSRRHGHDNWHHNLPYRGRSHSGNSARWWDDFYGPAPEPPIPRPAVIGPPPAPRYSRPSRMHESAGDRYAQSYERQVRDELLRLREENRNEAEYYEEWGETMPEWRKGEFQIKDAQARNDRIEAVLEMLRRAREAENRDTEDLLGPAGIV